MTAEPSQFAERDEQLEAILADFLQRPEAGQAEGREALLARHPEFAAELAEFFGMRDRVNGVADPLRQAVLTGPPPAAPEAAAGDGNGTDLGQLGDFRLIREVGRGGMGIVYEAEQVSLRRRVALKVLPLAATLDPRQLARFRNETYAAASLHHQHIVPVYYVGCERGVHYYAMQFIDGQPLSAVLQGVRRAPGVDQPAPETGDEPTAAYRPGVPTPAAPAAATQSLAALTTKGPARGAGYFRAVARLGEQAAEALQHAHDLGVLHRDVKPGNLLLDARGNVWVADFGLARVQSEASLTATGDLVGTLRYMSPEQALARRVAIDHRTDVYSLGATLYELLTLRPVFAGKDRQELLRQISFEEPVAPRRVRQGVPAELETIVLKALEKNPADRYATAQELADDLQRFLKDEPVRARRPTLAKRFTKWARRHRPAVTAGAVVVLMALALTGYIAWTSHDRAVRRAASEQVILVALDESRTWQEQRRLPEALAAARRAEGLLAGGDVNEALRQGVQARRADLELLGRLENVRLERWTAVRDGHYDDEGADALYGQTLRAAGLDVEALPAEEAAERLRRSTVAAELAMELDVWAWNRKVHRGPEDPSWKHLLRVARLADPDAWRTRLRRALEGGDWRSLRELAASEEAAHLPPGALVVLGRALLEDKEARGQAEQFLRQAQQRHPNDFWLNHYLFHLYHSVMQPPQPAEALPFAAVAVALRPGSAGAHVNLGNVLKATGRLDQAIAEHKEAIRIKSDYAEAHNNLGVALFDKGQLDEAIAECKEAIRIKSDYAWAHCTLGSALARKGRLDEAGAAYREAIALEKDFAAAHTGLGATLYYQGRLDEAIVCHRRALALDPKYATAHLNLGAALQAKGQRDEAIACFRRALELDPKDAYAHTNLGAMLAQKGQLDEGIACCRKAVELDPKFAWAHTNLGSALYDKGRLDEAITCYREALALDPKDAKAHTNLARALKLVQVRDRLSAVLQGQDQPKDAGERLAFADFCQQPFRQQYAAAVRFYAEAFAADPKLADDLQGQPRYNAACAAALAGCGQGKDSLPAADLERARLRRQSLDWLRADLGAWQKALAKDPAKARDMVAKTMAHWLGDTDLAGVRGAEALDRLPESERQLWQQLWQDVQGLCDHAGKGR
jgi:serine/threonine protein kinase/Flp pilus assembly protein TadD